MTTEQKVDEILDAIENAKNMKSKMDEVSWSVPALSSLRLRHLMNNLGAISNKYLECGVHKGGLFCSTIRNNQALDVAYYIDSFESDKTTGENVGEQFLQNAMKCGPEMVFLGRVCDTFEVESDGATDIDLYLYDAAHDYESQRKAITHFLPSMADEFILCVDDYDWDEVRRGTADGIKDAEEKGYEVVFFAELKGNDHDNDGFWNGFFVALFKKTA